MRRQRGLVVRGTGFVICSIYNICLLVSVSQNNTVVLNTSTLSDLILINFVSEPRKLSWNKVLH